MNTAILALDIALSVIGMGLLVLALVLLIQVLAAVWPGQTRGTAFDDVQRPPIAVLVPAHDEELGIEPVLAAVRAGLTAQDRVLVVADNCTDNTAAVARAAGAEVVERFDTSLVGKGYALDFGIRHLAARAPDVVIVIDADCLVEADALDRLARSCKASARPVQALYLMHAPPHAGSKQRIAEFAWIVKNQVRALGYQRLGLPCQLMGTGMAFPWAILERAPVASGHIVEDLQLGLDLAEAGTPPVFCPEAVVRSSFPARTDSQETQRTRWEHGHLGVIAKIGPKLLMSALRRGDMRLAAMALDVCVPPIAALVLALLMSTTVAALVAPLGSGVPLLLSGTALGLVVAAIAIAWHRFGRAVVSFTDLMGAPLYAMRKAPLYARMLGRRQTEWVRTRRDDRPN